jgi:hypothetical protein
MKNALFIHKVSLWIGVTHSLSAFIHVHLTQFLIGIQFVHLRFA